MTLRKESQISCENKDGMLYLYHHDGKDVRMITIDNEGWWVLADLCRLLGLKSNPTAVSKKLDEKDVKKLVLPHPHHGKPALIVICVNERALGNLVIWSKKPDAYAFYEGLMHSDAHNSRRINKLVDEFNAIADSMSKLNDRMDELDVELKELLRRRQVRHHTDNSKSVKLQMIS